MAFPDRAAIHPILYRVCVAYNLTEQLRACVSSTRKRCAHTYITRSRILLAPQKLGGWCKIMYLRQGKTSFESDYIKAT
jgi:hypothetical protein